MQVLGGLIKLSHGKNDLPLPWWHRSPLGLLHKTPVYLALIESDARPVGDLIVSVLNPTKWHQMLKVKCEAHDEPGVIAKIFDGVLPLNIAVAETVTIETGEKHVATLICEPFGLESAEKEEVESKFKDSGLLSVTVEPFLERTPKLLWHDVAEVDYGWVKGTKWRQELGSQYAEHLSEVSLDKVVVSADTEKRILRFVFPRKGAKTLKIEHADIPGALRMLTQVIADCDANILSALLRRGGAKPTNAVLVAVCEPTVGKEPRLLGGKLREGLGRLPQRLRANWSISPGVKDITRIYSRHPDDLIARVPEDLRPLIPVMRSDVPAGKTPVFLSRRFLSGPRREKIVRRVHSILSQHGCKAIEATPIPGNLTTSITQVSAKMWLSKAGIVLVAGAVAEAFSVNLAHEAGFLQGQGKPVLLLVEEGSAQGMRRWSNIHGLVAPRFSANESAFDDEGKDSLRAAILPWIDSWRRSGR